MSTPKAVLSAIQYAMKGQTGRESMMDKLVPKSQNAAASISQHQQPISLEEEPSKVSREAQIKATKPLPLPGLQQMAGRIQEFRDEFSFGSLRDTPTLNLVELREKVFKEGGKEELQKFDQALKKINGSIEGFRDPNQSSANPSYLCSTVKQFYDAFQKYAE
jgi:hypothetical protein